MTQDDMVKVARECGIGLAYGRESIERFYTFVAAAEREACAKLCKNEEATLLHKEGLTLPRGNPMLLKMASVANFCAAAIRARSDQEQPR